MTGPSQLGVSIGSPGPHTPINGQSCAEACGAARQCSCVIETKHVLLSKFLLLSAFWCAQSSVSSQHNACVERGLH